MARALGVATKRLKMYESLRSENDANGPFPAQPFGRLGLWASYGVVPPQRIVLLIRFVVVRGLRPKFPASRGL